ncbi:response regulator [Ktedonosporobacter rubrisoli]|uniref:Response regulator n=1 Tax=Ktedonosporobacter rubrisoli TaxID=2509675 RepID=A0A4P6JYG9_KTERU|nr:response regulator [Ktedonosporobacter rubrisoli]QBD80490.1 response regulator [Ktedonosporobacter rubrisoli]
MSTESREILVVDDDPIIRDMMVDIFDLEGYPIRVARNGREALEKMRQGKRYLVFLDLMMPVMDGREVCLQLDAEPEVRKRHVIVVMSAMDNLAQAATLNVEATMPKPFSVDNVLQIIQPYME